MILDTMLHYEAVILVKEGSNVLTDKMLRISAWQSDEVMKYHGIITNHDNHDDQRSK